MTKFFEEFPESEFDYQCKNNSGLLQTDTVVLKDISISFKLSDEVANNNEIDGIPVKFKYILEDNYRPEYLSHIYYDDPYKFWAILKSNEIFDVYTGFPIPQDIFDDFIFRKYREDAIGQINPRTNEEYPDTPEGVLSYTQLTIIDYIDEDGDGIDVFQFDEGKGHKAISIYQSEFAENEKRRSINLISSAIIDRVEKDLSDQLGEIE